MGLRIQVLRGNQPGLLRYLLADHVLDPVTFRGKLASLLGIANEVVTEKAFNRITTREDPWLGTALTKMPFRQEKSPSWIHLVFHHDKSLEIHTLGSPERREHFYRSCRTAARYAVENALARHPLCRRGKAGGAGREKAALVDVDFVHTASRAGDPATHVHKLLSVLAARPDGSYGTIDPRFLLDVQRSMNADYQWCLAREMNVFPGTSLRYDAKKGHIVEPRGKAITDKGLFATRRKDIKSRVQAAGQPLHHHAFVHGVAQRNKPAKDARTHKERVASWQKTARDNNIHIERCLDPNWRPPRNVVEAMYQQGTERLQKGIHQAKAKAVDVSQQVSAKHQTLKQQAHSFVQDQTQKFRDGIARRKQAIQNKWEQAKASFQSGKAAAKGYAQTAKEKLKSGFRQTKDRMQAFRNHSQQTFHSAYRTTQQQAKRAKAAFASTLQSNHQRLRASVRQSHRQWRNVTRHLGRWQADRKANRILRQSFREINKEQLYWQKDDVMARAIYNSIGTRLGKNALARRVDKQFTRLQTSGAFHRIGETRSGEPYYASKHFIRREQKLLRELKRSKAETTRLVLARRQEKYRDARLNLGGLAEEARQKGPLFVAVGREATAAWLGKHTHTHAQTTRALAAALRKPSHARCLLQAAREVSWGRGVNAVLERAEQLRRSELRIPKGATVLLDTHQARPKDLHTILRAARRPFCRAKVILHSDSWKPNPTERVYNRTHQFHQSQQQQASQTGPKTTKGQEHAKRNSSPSRQPQQQPLTQSP